MNREDVIKDTQTHVETVTGNLLNLGNQLVVRGAMHDKSKFDNPEIDIFVEYTPKLRKMKYMSEEYKVALKGMKPGLDHHYASNRHHPEYFKNGILDMSLIDILEMLSDWKASVERTKDGDIFKSLEINSKRFNIPSEVSEMMKKTLIQMMSIVVEIKNIKSNTIVFSEYDNTMEGFLEKVTRHRETSLFTEDYDLMDKIEELIGFNNSYDNLKKFIFELNDTEFLITIWRNVV